jgi:hypothetical protein
MAVAFLHTNVHLNNVAEGVITPILKARGHVNPAGGTLPILTLKRWQSEGRK